MAFAQTTFSKPRLFVGSSSESLPVAQAVQLQLHREFTVELWSQGIFEPNRFTIEDLQRAVGKADLGLFILAPDDIAKIRTQEQYVARDNVLFELGMFFGALDRSRSFFLVPEERANFRIPTDLAGMTPLTYDVREFAGNARAAVAPACTILTGVVRSQIDNSPLRSGAWRQKWQVGADEERKENESDAELLVLGNRVRAAYGWANRTYLLEGTLSERYLTGTWRDVVSGPTYHGAFQLLVSPRGEKMTGCWVGWSSRGACRSGAWEWRLQPPGSSAAREDPPGADSRGTPSQAAEGA